MASSNQRHVDRYACAGINYDEASALCLDLRNIMRVWCTHREPVDESSFATSPIHAFGEHYLEASSSQYLTRLVVGTSLLGLSCQYQAADITRGDRPPKDMTAHQNFLSKFDSPNGEPTIGSSGYISGNVADYSSKSYRSSIVTSTPAISDPYHKPKDLQRAKFHGGDNKPDGKLFNEFSPEKNLKLTATNKGNWEYRGAFVTQSSMVATAKESQFFPKLQRTQENPVVEKVAVGYTKPSYPVLIGNDVVVCDTKLFATLPLHDKYMVKDRVQGASGVRAKLVLKSSAEKR